MPTFQAISLDISLVAGGECEQFLEMSPSFFKTRTLAGKSNCHSMGPALQIHELLPNLKCLSSPLLMAHRG